MMHFAWQAQGFCALRCRCLKPSMQNPWKGCKFHVTEVLASQGSFRVAVTGVRMPRLNFCVAGFEACTRKSLKRIAILRSSVSSTCHF